MQNEFKTKGAQFLVLVCFVFFSFQANEKPFHFHVCI